MTANTPRLLRHPFHEHALIFQELSESFRFECQICGFSSKGVPAYHCIDCEFFLHKWCAELPPEIQHPSHPQHPLVFSTSSWNLRCYGCRKALRGKWYQCFDCRIDLHVGCAAATLPPPEEEEHKDEQKHEEEMIEHFAHDHPLASFHADAPNYIECKACGEGISGRVYGCRACIFVLHESCALAPREIMNHPFHPQHPLTLLVNSKPSFRCEICGSRRLFAYNCNECGFILGVNCAVSIMHPPPRNDQSCSTDDRRDHIHHFSDPHQLTYFHAKLEFPATCRFCREGISGDFYCCPDCLFLLHPSCSKLTQEIVHPLHPDHPLIFQEDRLKCSLCSSYLYDFVFKCEECPFGLHVRCALQSLSSRKEELTLDSEFFHEHPMSLRCLKGCKSVCIVCEGPVKGLGYTCEICDCAVIHKTCAELPRESERQPIHPQHLLLLLSKPLDKSSPCFACQESSGGFTFCCDYCKIQFHAHCAMRRQTLKHQRHEHSLSYFDKIGCELYSAQCNVCYDDCRIDFYRCVPCNYNLHFSCMSLPPSVKHEFHFHPLVLRDRVVDEYYDYKEQYCDVCETLRNPEHGVYYCEECNYDAHIDCVIPKVSPTSQNSTTFSFSEALSS
ncbi:hypothetical protein CDL15_Pgr001597 [Punica granatum]|uniref:Phorbol-ester/DAG-type domain-containing protein n=1 Tax=Punica granatum TaxID=22663 RepID=A0A218XAQ1_PUNGR|nr:hypothetical protein CDL15_Pgr001597 [Punica granatum]